jgi:branched-chain amino acid transport system permease protein
MSKLNMIWLVLLVAVLLVFPLKANPYIVQVAMTWLTYAILGINFVLSMRAGLPRIDVVTWWSIGGFTTALLMNSGLNFFLAALLAGILCMILGWIVFSFIIPRGVTAFFTSCVVLFLFGPNLVGFLFKVPFLRGAGGQLPPASIGPLQFILKPELYYLGLFFMALNIVVLYLLYDSKIGKAWDSINSSPKLAQSVGVDVVKYRVFNMVIGNFFISLAGSYLIAYSNSAPPVMFSLQAGIMVMMYSVIGGISHSFSGPLLGSFLLTFIPEYLRSVKEYETILTSVITILVLIFMPAGILGWIDGKVLPRLHRSEWYLRLKKAGAKEVPETLE